MDEMQVLFCRPQVDQDQLDGFEVEAEVAERLGLGSHELPIEPLVDGEAEQVLEGIIEQGRRYLYRGWMLTEEEHGQLQDAVSNLGGELATSTDAYALAHYLPQHHSLLEGRTPPAVWTEEADAEDAWLAACGLGRGPWIIKDHVKSAKEFWEEACFIPEGSDRDAFVSSCERLMEVRGERFERGFVVRPFVQLRSLPFRTPERVLPDEHRLVFVDGRLVAHAPYHEVGDPMPNPEQFAWLGETVPAAFFTADVAQLETGDWTVIELNDGGVSRMPADMDLFAIYEALSHA